MLNSEPLTSVPAKARRRPAPRRCRRNEAMEVVDSTAQDRDEPVLLRRQLRLTCVVGLILTYCLLLLIMFLRERPIPGRDWIALLMLPPVGVASFYGLLCCLTLRAWWQILTVFLVASITLAVGLQFVFWIMS